MKITNTILCAGMIAALPLVGCTEPREEPTDDELAGESDDDGEAIGKADGPESTFTFYNVAIDYRRCMYPVCGGYYVSRVNRAYTRCGDGSWAEQCYLPEIDWSGLGMPDAQVDEVRAEIASGKLLLRGVMGTRNFGENFGDMSVLTATEAWMGGSDQQPAGVVTKVTDSGVRCITTPCYNTLHEAKINSLLDTDMSELYLEDTGVDPAELEGAYGQVFDNGLIVAGYRYWWWDGGWQKGRYVTQFWERVVPRELGACVVGGCSSQVCADANQGPIVTTCEWRPEYACYRTATCERQVTGECGWTLDQDLSDCLSNPPTP